MKLVNIFCGVALVAALTAPARAAVVTISLQEAGVNSGAITQVASSTDVGGTDGFASFTGSYGTFSINSVNGQSVPLVSDAINGNSINTSSSAGGTLEVFVTASGLTMPTNAFFSKFTENSLSNGSTVQEITFLNSTQLAKMTYNGPTSAASSTATTFMGAGPGPYSVTEEYIITAPEGGGSANSTIVVSVPETSTWAMMIFGFLGVGFVAYRRQGRASFRFA